jgi:hypothetical protein
MFPLSCVDARPRSNRNASAHTEYCHAAGILEFFNFHCKYSYYAYYEKKFYSAAQSSGRVKLFCSEQYTVRAAVKKIRRNSGQNRKYGQKILSQCDVVLHKSCMGWPGIEPEPPQ